MERYIGFWAAFLLCFCALWVGVIMLLICKNRYVKTAPAGSVMPKILRVISLGIKERFSLSAAEPKVQMEKNGREVLWDGEFVDGVRSALLACQICNLISQAGQMETYGIPNDVMPAFDPIACIITGPSSNNGCSHCSIDARCLSVKSMKSIVQALFVGTASISYALGIAISPVAKDPCMVVFYACLTGVQIAITILFWLKFRYLNKAIVV